MKRALIFLICSVLAFSCLSFAAVAAEPEATDTTAAIETETVESETAAKSADAALAPVGADTQDTAPTGYSLHTEASFAAKLSYLRAKYVHGSIWEGVYYEDGSPKAWECFAYAAQMMYEIFGARYIADRLYELIDYDRSNITKLNAGDIVRIDGDSHSIFITEVTPYGYFFTDGNGTGVYNQVRWDGFYSMSEMQSRFTYRVHLPGNSLRGGGLIHVIDYDGNGGSGTMAVSTLGSNESFTIQANEFTRSGYDFAGYIVQRESDNAWFTSDAKWQSQSAIFTNGYHYKIYKPGESYTINSAWLGNSEDSATFTFYAQWLPKTSTVEYMSNYSGFNYLLGSDLGDGYDEYIYSRDTSVYTMSVDGRERLNNADSLKIVGKSAGKSGTDLAFITSTNRGYGTEYSQAGVVGDDKSLTLRFYAKSSVNGAKMFFRWGYSTSFESVTLSTGWRSYAVKLPKTPFYSYGIHPYFDRAGTFYLNSLTLSDNDASNITPESGAFEAAPRSVPRGDTLDYMPQPERNGYVFTGWYTAAEGGTLITEDTPITWTTVRLYAHWRKDIAYTPIRTLRYNGHIYELYDNSLGWLEAEMFCEIMGGHLVTIHDQAENNIVLNMIGDLQGYCWLGLRCVDKAHDWQWVDDATRSGYSNWFSDEYYEADTKEYYTMMYPMDFGGKKAGEWDKCIGSRYHFSYYGYYNSFFICEFDMPSLRGDANGDGEVDSLDATLLQRYAAGLPVDVSEDVMQRADVDDNTVLDVADATCILRYAAGIETPYDVGGRYVYAKNPDKA